MSLPPLPELEPWAKCMVVREDVAQMRMREYGALCRRMALDDAAEHLRAFGFQGAASEVESLK